MTECLHALPYSSLSLPFPPPSDAEQLRQANRSLNAQLRDAEDQLNKLSRSASQNQAANQEQANTIKVSVLSMIIHAFVF